MKLTQEAFEEWKDHPVGEMFFKMIAGEVAVARDKWLQSSWNGGVCDPQNLATLKGNAEVFEQLQGMTAQDIEERLYEQRERD